MTPSAALADMALTASEFPGFPLQEVGSRKTQSANKRLHCINDVRILVLDDDPAIGKLIQIALSKQQFLVEVVSDAARMLPKLEQQSYHLIITDYCIPGLQPTQLLSAIRDQQADASVVVVTAYPSVDSALNCLRAHTHDYLTKPFEIQQLLNTVNRCLREKGLLRLSEQALRETLGAVIRDRRKAMGLTLADMAKRTNVSLGYLSQIELGKNSASVETLYRISLGLGIRMAELFQQMQPSL